MFMQDDITISAPYIGTHHIFYSANQIKSIAAHEFGHILGIDDAYPESNGRPDATRKGLSIVGYSDIMYYRDDKSPNAVSGWDVAMAMQAYTENKWQFWGNYLNSVNNVQNYRSAIIGTYNCN